ncbi:MAG: lysine--tRNA ligase [Treponema sp.]|nr:lysine--tRNA ligase [Treponema sp.]
MRYDFVNLKGVPGKMSSSKGKVIALPDALDVYQAEVLRYMFAGTRPDTEFSISFDLDVLKVYEDYDKTERVVYGIDPAKGSDDKKKEEFFNKEKRIYMLSQPDGKIPEVMPYQITIRMLSTLLQIYSGDIDKVIAALGDVKPEQEERLRRRCACAWFWIQHSAPDCAPDFCFALRTDGSKAELDDTMLTAVKRVRDEVVPKMDTFTEDKACQQAMYDIATEMGIDAKALFTTMYQVLIGKDQGPRLGSFCRIIGKETLSKILAVY